jgi:hypothetical protein
MTNYPTRDKTSPNQCTAFCIRVLHQPPSPRCVARIRSKQLPPPATVHADNPPTGSYLIGLCINSRFHQLCMPPTVTCFQPLIAACSTTSFQSEKLEVLRQIQRSSFPYLQSFMWSRVFLETFRLPQYQ